MSPRPASFSYLHILCQNRQVGRSLSPQSGVQYMCSEGVDLLQSRCKRRPTSNSILAYVDNSLLEQTKSVARDIAKNTKQEEQVTQPAASSDNTHSGPAPAKPYVKATRPRSKIHIKCSSSQAQQGAGCGTGLLPAHSQSWSSQSFSKFPQTTTWLNCALAAAKL